MSANVALKGKNIVVLGADESAVALIKFLNKKGAVTTVADTRSLETVQAFFQANEVELEKIKLECGELNIPKIFEGIELVILAPQAQRYISPKVWEAARALNISVVSELEFVSQFLDEENVVAFASTNGKSTSAHLLKSMLEAQGETVFANIDQPASLILNQSKPVKHVLFVVDAAQLENINTFKSKYIVIHNLSEDYFTRYQSYENYQTVIRQIFRNATAETVLVHNLDNPMIAQLNPIAEMKTLQLASKAFPEGQAGGWYDKTHAHIQTADGQKLSFNMSLFRLRGALNKENFLAAALIAVELGVKQEAIFSTIDNVRAPAGRVEFIKRINSIAFYDDSHSTNVNAIHRSLYAFTEPVILISGGRDRGLDYATITPHIRQRVKNMILVGESKEKLNRMMGDFTETFLVGTIEEAVLMAYQKSRSGDVILLSPGCDPSDMYPCEKTRSEHFKKLVHQITQPRKPSVIF